MTIEELKEDYNWRQAFQYATAFSMDDVEEILGLREGENDGPNWLIYGRLKDQRFFYLSAGCDYTGWDCQAGGFSGVDKDFDQFIRFSMDEEGREAFNIKIL